MRTFDETRSSRGHVKARLTVGSELRERVGICRSSSRDLRPASGRRNGECVICR